MVEFLGSIAWGVGLMEKADPRNPTFWHNEPGKLAKVNDVVNWKHGARIREVSDVCDQVALNPSLNPTL